MQREREIFLFHSIYRRHPEARAAFGAPRRMKISHATHPSRRARARTSELVNLLSFAFFDLSQIKDLASDKMSKLE
jgi:hypothetical protein